MARIHGRVLDTSGTPVSGAVLDVWGTNGRGLYENVDPSQLYTDDDPYLGSDAVFGVKPSLVVRYDHIDDGEALAAIGRGEPYWDLEYDFILTPGQASSAGFSAGRR